MKSFKNRIWRTSKRFELDWRDIVKGAVMAALTAVLIAVRELSVNKQLDTLSINFITNAAIAGGTAYLIGRLVSPSTIVKKHEDINK